MLAGALVIFLLVLGLFLLVLCRPGLARRVPADRWIWIGGVVLPLGILAALIGHGLMRGESLLAGGTGDDPLRVEARGRMWQWEFHYAGGTRSSRDILHIPVGTTVLVTATSRDVIHSFWVPRLGGKIDATPGHAASVRIRADRAGVYGGVCSEYCGTGHSGMRFEVRAHPADTYAAVVSGLPVSAREQAR